MSVAAVTAIVAGAAQPAAAVIYTYDWHGTANTKWSTMTNWVGNVPPPANSGNDEVSFDLPIASLGGSQTDLDIANMTVRGLSFANNASNTNASVRIASNVNSLKFDNAAKFIRNDNDKLHNIDVNVALANQNNLEFFGSGSPAGRVTINGVVSGTSGITVNHTGGNGGGSLFLRGNNTFTGGVNLTSGLLRVGHDSALGTGKLVINGNAGAIASDGGNFAPTNDYDMNGGFFTVARGGVTNKLTLKGRGNFTGLHQVTLDSAADVLDLNGQVDLPNAGMLRFVSRTGTQAPEFVKNPARGKSPLAKQNATASMTGLSPNFRGTLEAKGVTLKVERTLGALGTEMAGATFGDPAPAPGPGQLDTRVRTAVLARRGSFFVNNAKQVSLVGGKHTLWDLKNGEFTTSRGESEPTLPGVATISGGGGFSMEPETGFSVFVEGTSPGNDPYQHSQLVMNDGGAIALGHDQAMNTRPVLYAALSENYEPSVGDRYKIIDQTSSLAPRLDTGNNLFQVDPEYSSVLNSPVPGEAALYDGSIFRNSDGVVWQIRYGLSAGDAGATPADMNDVFLSVVAVPEPTCAAFTGLPVAALLRRRRGR
jgi:autotransporter-associated beta strand protein